MNKPSRPTPPFQSTSPPYELDGFGWAMAQAELVRQRRFDELDIENIAEELESVGKSERGSGETALRVLMMHILKWRYQPERRCRSWALSIKSQRIAFDDIIGDNPSLKARLDDMRDKAYRRARIDAASEADLPLQQFPSEPLDWQTILHEPFEYESA